ncbi:hypothetical protein NQ314_016271 [Rhamnusium bicolor]|uniref:Lipocalin/cytosolic fatty-acid binding domain-containing protein n=1 Tax=Rhamnusium bicolor TaxID=1586634 RepID=A0AAV8WXC7_9CUCU|nr:hypothetical protein NQ314_016271 [Rhamnusium bicolor]
MIRIHIILCLSIIAKAQVPSLGFCPEYLPMAEFDIDRFLGKWYETERYFQFSEVASRCVVTDYAMTASGKIYVSNEITNRLTGIKRVIEGHVELAGKANEGKLNVKYSTSPISTESTLTILDTDYDSFAVIWSCNGFGPIHARVAKLTGENWTVWKFQVQVAHKPKGYFGIVKGTMQIPVPPADFKQWDSNDAKAQEIIVCRLDEKVVTHILSCQNAADMWKKLEAIYEHQNQASVYLFTQRFFSLEYSEGNAAEFMSQLEEIKGTLKSLGDEIKSVWVMTRDRIASDPVMQTVYGILDKFKISRTFFIKTDQKGCAIAASDINAAQGIASVSTVAEVTGTEQRKAVEMENTQGKSEIEDYKQHSDVNNIPEKV